MQEGQFSRTALGAAGRRAAHQVLDGGRVFADPLALRILGEDAQRAVAEARADPALRGLRLYVAVRSRFAEDAAKRAIGRGVRQIVVLGAGLDTFAYRVEPSEGLRVFEVDYPATQAEKRRRLAAAAIAIPEHVVYAGCDFESEGLAGALAACGFDAQRPSFFLWLGVVSYLTEPAIFAALAFIAELPGGGEVAFDYANPAASIADDGFRKTHEIVAARAEAAGEPLRTSFATSELHEKLRELGFRRIEDLGPNEIVARFFPERAARSRENGGHVVLAGTL
ncbi:MAG: SAM-dependent methyltransferase [Roseiarcus sp.]|jgi:methyltransferase (TIGR00027 family)